MLVQKIKAQIMQIICVSNALSMHFVNDGNVVLFHKSENL